MRVILGRHGCDLPLGGPVGVHVVAAQRGVDGHEAAVRLVRLAAWRRRDAGAHGHQRREVFLRARDIPARFEQRECLGFLGDVHLLRAERQRHVAGAGFQALQRQVHGGAARGAGIFHIEDGDAFNADLGKHDLAGNRNLALQRAVGHAGVVGRTNVGTVAAGVLKRAVQRLARQIVERACCVAPKHRHGDAGDIELFHSAPQFRYLKSAG